MGNQYPTPQQIEELWQAYETGGQEAIKRVLEKREAQMPNEPEVPEAVDGASSAAPRRD